MTIAFDLDGTLISVEQKQTSLLRAVAQQYGLKLDLPAIWTLKRDGLSTHAALLSEGVPADLCGPISSRWVAAVETPYWMSLDTLLGGARECLTTAATTRGVALVSARQNGYLLRQQLLRLNLLQFFTSVHRVSPGQAVTEKAGVLKQIGAVCFIGDTETDCEAARKAETPFLAVSTGQRSADYLSRIGVTDIFSSLPKAMRAM